LKRALRTTSTGRRRGTRRRGHRQSRSGWQARQSGGRGGSRRAIRLGRGGRFCYGSR
jgi:hypothetical protein